MRRSSVGLGGALLAIAVTASPAAGQIANQPVYISPKHGTGLSLALDFGKGLNDNSTKLNAYGGHVTLGLGFITVSAGAASVSNANLTAGDSEISVGGTVQVKVFDAPLAPVGVSIFGGFGTIDRGGGSIKSFPVGAAVAVKLPTPGLGIELWAAPRLNIVNVESSGLGGGGTETDVGISGGVNLSLPTGLGIHVALDFVSVGDTDGDGSNDNPLILGVGAHYKFAIPGLGM